jgi:DNA-binding CsgD family transcriptional regulator
MLQTFGADTRSKIYQLGQQTPFLSNREIARRLDIGKDAVAKYRDTPVEAVELKPVELDLELEIRSKLRKGPLSASEIADLLDVSPKTVRAAVKDMKVKGVSLMETPDGRYDIAPSFASEPGKDEEIGTSGEWTHTFGITTDNHLCNKHSRLDVLNAAYDHFESRGITQVFNCGNWVDGEARFNKTELVTSPGMDNQLDYMIDKWPVKKGIVTKFVAGDDHEGWYSQREGIEIGKYLQYRAEDQGREDLKYLGYGEADVALRYGTGEAVMRVLHPGGGSSYAVSYTDQKRVESYQGGDKPKIELAGHYHKYNHGYPREVNTVQCGCTTDQSLFMRKKRLQAMVGFVVVKIQQEKNTGIITRFSPEWFPYFDRGFYEKRFS